MNIRQVPLWTDAEVTTEAIAFQQIQGYALVRHGKPVVCLGILTYAQVDSAAVHLLLAEYGRAATSAWDLYQSYVAHQRDPASPAVGVVQAVGLTASALQHFPGGQLLSDTAFNNGFLAAGPDMSAIVVLAGDADQAGGAGAALIRLRNDLTAKFNTLATIQWEEGKPGARPLGFEDGISQPIFFEIEKPPGALHYSYNPAATLGLVLLPQPGATDEYGSFMAYVKFRFDQQAYRLSVNAVVNASGRSADEVESWFLGRVRQTSEPLSRRGSSLNDFDYLGPSDALCPAGAHIRTMNPRAENSRSNRILRRGAVYSNGAETGLLFQCFQSNLTQGFETLFRNWASGLAIGPDAILALRASAAHPAAVVGNLPPTSPVAAVAGGAYFYFPSIPFFARALNQ